MNSDSADELSEFIVDA